MNSTAFQTFQQVALFFFTPKCFDNYFIDLVFFDGECFKSTLSKALGFGIILGSLLVKVPQIIKLLNSKSGEGINMYSVTLDLAAITIHMSYNFVKGFPFSSWGDTLFVGIQTVIIAFLVLYYQGSVINSVLYVIIYGAVCFALMGGITPINILWTLTSINIFIIAAGKLLQAWTNFKNGHTGQLSAATLIMLFAGSVARIFTTIQETSDPVLILTYVSSSSVNAVLLGQLIYYWGVTDKRKKE